jgi:hypothetical protein
MSLQKIQKWYHCAPLKKNISPLKVQKYKKIPNLTKPPLRHFWAFFVHFGWKTVGPFVLFEGIFEGKEWGEILYFLRGFLFF